VGGTYPPPATEVAEEAIVVTGALSARTGVVALVAPMVVVVARAEAGASAATTAARARLQDTRRREGAFAMRGVIDRDVDVVECIKAALREGRVTPER
jgi:hypothetical protein